MKVEQVVQKIQEDIVSGSFGRSGSRFPTVNGVMERYAVSYVTALKAVSALIESGTLLQIGKKNYLATGIADTRSDLYQYLHTQKTKRVGILVRTLNPFFSTVIELICKELQTRDIFPIIKFCEEETAVQDIKTLVDEQCLGIISFCFFYENPAFNGFIERLPLPVVFVGQDPKSKRPAVFSDNYYSGYRAAQHLVSCGYEEFYFVAQNATTYNDRLLGFKTGICESGFSFGNANVIPFSENTLKNTLLQLIERTDKRVGIFCMHDVIGYFTFNALSQSGISVPEKVGLIGYDKLETNINQIKLTSLYYSLPNMAQCACDLLIEYVKRPLKTPKLVKLQSILYVRDTTAK